MERSADPQTVGGKAVSQPIPHRVIADSATRCATLLDEALRGDIIVVAGSFYLLGEIRPLAEEIAPVRLARTRLLHLHREFTNP